MKRSVLPILAVLGLVWAAFACASASAEVTALCKAEETPCRGANIYPEGTAITAETKETSDQVEIATPGVTIKCPSKLEATVGSSSGGTQSLSVSSWSLGNSSEGCTGLSSKNDCGTASGENLPYSAEATWPNENLLIGGPSWHLHCSTGLVTYINCTYYEKPTEPHFTGDHKALQYSGYEFQHAGSACGGSAAWVSGTFRIVKPEAAIYVSRLGAPLTTPGEATSITTTSATLNGTVNPEGSATSYYFKYGTTTAYGSKTSTSSAGSGATDVAVSKAISGLTSGTTYHYCLFAESPAGTSECKDKSFVALKLPKAKTEAPTAFKGTSATLNGTVNPEGSATSYYFKYGTTTAYGSTTSTSSAGEGASDVAVSKTISGLTSGTTYHYCLVSESKAGQSNCEDMTVIPGGPPIYRSSFGKGGVEEDQFGHPAGVAVDSSGDLWVADAGGARVEKWSPGGEFLFAFGEAGSLEGQLQEPSSVAVDSEGNVWVADTGNDRIEKFSDEGEFLLAVGEEGEEDGQFSHPEALAIDPSGNVWVTDTFNERLQEFDSEGSWMRTSEGGGRLETPTGIALSPSGNLIYVADRSKNRIYEFVTINGSPIFAREWGKEGSGNGQFIHPDALDVDAEGNVWAVDEGNHRVQEFTGSGEYITKFGSFGFEVPSGIATDSKGNIWVSNAMEYRVEKWSR